LGIERLGHGRRFCWTAEGDRRDLAVSPIASLGQVGDAPDEAIGAIDRELAASVKADETANRLMTIPGVGPSHRLGDHGHDPGRQRLREPA
jgi:hypothetical protein